MIRPLVVFVLALPAVAETPEEGARRVLTTRQFTFCQENEHPISPGDEAWCSIRKEATTCPQLEEMCAREPPPGGVFGSLGGGAGGAGKTPGKTLGEGETGTAPGRPPEWDVPLPRLDFLLWVFLGLVLGVVAFLVVRAIVERRRTELPPEEEPAAEGPGAVVVDPGLGEVELLLREARRVAAEDVARALALLYGALLRHLEDHKLIEWDSAKTNREYVRAVRGRTPLDRPMAELVREVERTKFGRVTPVRDVFEAMYARIAPLLGKSAAGLVVLLGLLGGCDCGRTDLDGTAAYNEIITGQGVKPVSFSMPLDQLDGNAPPVLVDGRFVRVDGTILAALHDAMLGGARVLVLGWPRQTFEEWPHLKVRDARDAPGAAESIEEPEAEQLTLDEILNRVNAKYARDGGSDDAGAPGDAGDPPDAGDSGEAGDAGDAGDPADGGSKPRVFQPPVPVTPTAAFATEAGLPADLTGWLPFARYFEVPPEELDAPDVLLEREGRPFALRWRSERGVLVFVADGSLFANGSMAVPANARLAVAVTKAVTRDAAELAVARVGVVDSAENPFESMERAGLWLLMLQALVVLAFVFWGRGAAFGVLRDRSLRTRREFREHVSAVGAQLARRQGSRLAASLYAAWAMERLWQRTKGDVDRLDSGALAHALALRLGEDEYRLRELLSRAEVARRDPHGVPVPEQDLLLIRGLGRLLEKLQADQKPRRKPQ